MHGPVGTRAQRWAAAFVIALELSVPRPSCCGPAIPALRSGDSPAAFNPSVVVSDDTDALRLRLRGGGFHKARKVRALNNWKPKHKREGENPLQVHKAHRMRKKEKDHASSERKVRNVLSSVKMEDREKLFAEGVISTPEVNRRFIRNQRVRAESARPAADPEQVALARASSAHLFGTDDSEEAGERGKGPTEDTSAPQVGPSARGQITDLNDLLASVSEFTEDSVDEFLRRHPEAAAEVDFVEGSRPTKFDADTNVAAAVGAGGNRTPGSDTGRAGVDASDVTMSFQDGEGWQAADVEGPGKEGGQECSAVPVPRNDSHVRGDLSMVNDTAASDQGGGPASGRSTALEYSKGEHVLYRAGNGSLLEASVIAIDYGIIPPSYTICISEGREDTSVRETEGHRLIKLPGGGGAGQGKGGGSQGGAGNLLAVGRHVDPEEQFYDVSSGAVLHSKMRDVVGPFRKRPPPLGVQQRRKGSGGGRSGGEGAEWQDGAYSGSLVASASVSASDESSGDTTSGGEDGDQSDGSDASGSDSASDSDAAEPGDDDAVSAGAGVGARGREGERSRGLPRRGHGPAADEADESKLEDYLSYLGGKFAMPASGDGDATNTSKGSSRSQQLAPSSSCERPAFGDGADVPIITPASGVEAWRWSQEGSGKEWRAGEGIWREGVVKSRPRKQTPVAGYRKGGGARAGTMDADEIMSNMLGHASRLRSAQVASAKANERDFRKKCGISKPGDVAIGARFARPQPVRYDHRFRRYGR